MTWLLTFIRSSFFNVLFVLWTLFVALIFTPLRWFSPSRALTRIVGRVWAHGSLALLRLFCGLTYRVEGKEHLQNHHSFIFACKHQSAWETIVLHLVLNTPAYILKKELLKLPLFGNYLRDMGSVAIDRSAGASALKDMVKGASIRLGENRPVIIFPEGTRGANGEKPTYQPGISALYSRCNVPVIPAALNSGQFWASGAYMKYPGTITLRILPAIEPELRRDQFMEKLYTTIEENSNALRQHDKR